MVILKVNNKEYKFPTVSDAYEFYLQYYSTSGDWVYYYALTGTMLSEVTNERIMEGIFRNVFDNDAYLLILRG